MAIRAGTRVGAYEVLSLLGIGGMGEVYRARDTTLDRDVALKVLPAEVAGDRDRIARFRREAQTLASLNHPNIGAIYGFEDSDGICALVLELVEGRTLADRIAIGPVPVGETLAIARQIAEALEAAHEKGILHRDLKPANISLTHDGRVKVLDFGIAKVLDAPGASATTVTVFQTGVATVIGTPAYMSPEQARGEAVGRQADIWAFGVVLYELLTGVSAFGRTSKAETLARVLEAQPDLTRLPVQTPHAVQRLLRRCLEKDPRRRLQHIGDARIEIEDAQSAPASERTTDARPDARRPWRLALGAAALAVVAGAAGWLVHRQSTATSAPTARVSVQFGEPAAVFPGGARRISVSRDGSTVAFAGPNRLWIRRLNQKDAVAVAAGAQNPFFSPDGLWVGAHSDGALIKVPIAGGPPVVIAASIGPTQGAVWTTDGTILFTTTAGLFVVSEDGGQPRQLAAPNRQRKEVSYAWPALLPQGRHILLTIVRDDPKVKLQLATLDIESGEIQTVLDEASSATFVDGHLVYASGSSLMTASFDPSTRQVSGAPVAARDVQMSSSSGTGAADFAVSASGTLVFLPPRAPIGGRTLAWIDRQGKEETLGVEPRAYAYPRISPDGRRVALDVSGENRDIWIIDLERLIPMRLTDDPAADVNPVWSNDGSRVYFSSGRGGDGDVYSQSADGASPAQLEYAGMGSQIALAFSADGRLIVHEDFHDLGLLVPDEPARLEPLLHLGRFVTLLGRVSPDGKWIAYESNESGRFEIWLRSFPDTSRRREQVSSGGGRFPLWGARGSNEMYFVTAAGAMTAVSVTLEPELKVGKQTKLFDWEKPPDGRSGMIYDISPRDGRFLVTRALTSVANPAYASVVINWLDELGR